MSEIINVIFVTQMNHVPFFCKDQETAQKLIKTYEDLSKQITQTEDKLLWHSTSDGFKESMVRCSQVVGIYMRVLKEDSSQKLAQAQTKLAEIIGKHMDEGSEWKE